MKTRGREEQNNKSAEKKVSAHTSGATTASTRVAGWCDTTIRKERVDGDVTAGEEDGNRKELPPLAFPSPFLPRALVVLVEQEDSHHSRS